MKWPTIIFLSLFTVIVFFIQQYFFINVWPVNLLLLIVVWLSFWKNPQRWLVALLAGFLLDFSAAAVGPAVISLSLICFLINYSSKYISLERFSHYLLVTFSSVLVFFLVHQLIFYLITQSVNKDLADLLVFSWSSFSQLLIGHWLILIIGYWLRPNFKLVYE